MKTTRKKQMSFRVTEEESIIIKKFLDENNISIKELILQNIKKENNNSIKIDIIFTFLESIFPNFSSHKKNYFTKKYSKFNRE